MRNPNKMNIVLNEINLKIGWVHFLLFYPKILNSRFRNYQFSGLAEKLLNYTHTLD